LQPRNRHTLPRNGRKPWIFNNFRLTHPRKLSIFGRPHGKNQQINMNSRIQNQLNMVGACITVANSTDYKPVWTGNPPADFGTDMTQLQAGYGNVTVLAAQADAATGGGGDASSAAETALENAAFILARALANHFKKNGDLDNLGKVDVTKTDIVRLRKQVLLDKATAILNLASTAVSDPAAAGRGVTAARIATLTAAIAAFGKVMNTPRGQIVNKSALLREVETDTAALVQLATDMDDLALQFDGTDAGKRFIEAWKRARIIVDTGGGHSGTPPTPPTPPATPHP
jgi:hypothetical protein